MPESRACCWVHATERKHQLGLLTGMAGAAVAGENNLLELMELEESLLFSALELFQKDPEAKPIKNLENEQHGLEECYLHSY